MDCYWLTLDEQHVEPLIDNEVAKLSLLSPTHVGDETMSLSLHPPSARMNTGQFLSQASVGRSWSHIRRPETESARSFILPDQVVHIFSHHF